jgi:hypothetical protein
MDHPELFPTRKIVREFLRAADILLNMTADDPPLNSAEVELLRSYSQRLTVKFAA